MIQPRICCECGKTFLPTFSLDHHCPRYAKFLWMKEQPDPKYVSDRGCDECGCHLTVIEDEANGGLCNTCNSEGERQ